MAYFTKEIYDVLLLLVFKTEWKNTRREVKVLLHSIEKENYKAEFNYLPPPRSFDGLGSGSGARVKLLDF